MAFALRFGWKTRVIDFDNAFIQATLPPDKVTYMDIPKGDFGDLFGSDLTDKCLRLKRSLYGITLAPRLWRAHLGTRLRAIGFRPSAHDPCLWFRGDVMLAEWVDDVYLQGPTDKAIDKALADLKASGMDYSDSGCLSDYLGLAIERTSSTFVLRQTGLIDKILSTMGLEDCNSVRLPMENPVGACLSSPPHDEPWDYAAALGLMTYLSIQTRPDIAVAVNILARYSSNP